MNGRSGPKAAPETPAKSQNPSVAATDVPRQIRDRRAASSRLEVLEDGRHDPLETPLETDLEVTTREMTSSLAARRQAWVHLNDAGLMCSLIDSMLRGAA